ncbi:MAG: hypothetical protein NC244_01465 [Alistipes senegalensis]|nr:hypothetical protein [Alistipes senegalensis]
MGTGRQYDEKFKVETVKLARDTGTKRAAEEPGIPEGTPGGCVRKAREGEIDTGSGSRSPG